LKAWNITDFDSIIPAAIKPSKDLGNLAIYNIRTISLRTTLTTAQDLFLNECKDETGAPIKLSRSHTAKIAKDLLEQDVAAKTARTGARNMSEKRASAETKATEPVMKMVGTPKVHSLSIFDRLY
jgi:hypothetical protein